MTTSLAAALDARADASLRRAGTIAARMATPSGAELSVHVELEQALDDAERYARLSQRLRTAGTPGPYQRGGRQLLPDLAAAAAGEPDAVQRLAGWRAQQAITAGLERRAVGTGALGAVVPPQHLVDDAATAVRAARPFADAVTAPLAAEGMSVVVGRITTGNVAGAQTAENATATSTDIAVTTLTAPVSTVAVRAVVSRQLIDRAGQGVDAALFPELFEAIAAEIDRLALVGTGAAGQPLGLLNVAGVGTATFAGATAAAFEQKAGALATTVAAARKRPGDLWVMHPRRWDWARSRAETATTSIARRELLDRPVIVDANIPTNLGAGTDEDAVALIRASDLRLYEAGPFVQVDTQSTAGAGSVVIVVWSYLAAALGRYPTGIGLMTGAGLNAVAT